LVQVPVQPTKTTLLPNLAKSNSLQENKEGSTKGQGAALTIPGFPWNAFARPQSQPGALGGLSRRVTRSPLRQGCAVQAFQAARSSLNSFITE